VFSIVRIEFYQVLAALHEIAEGMIFSGLTKNIKGSAQVAKTACF
jgi:hypothetical protein